MKQNHKYTLRHFFPLLQYDLMILVMSEVVSGNLFGHLSCCLILRESMRGEWDFGF
jgi:hypothetical protein